MAMFNKGKCRIIGIAVCKDKQRQGIGRMILKEIENACIQKNIHEMYTVSKTGLEFYSANGFMVQDVIHGDYVMRKYI